MMTARDTGAAGGLPPTQSYEQGPVDASRGSEAGTAFRLCGQWFFRGPDKRTHPVDRDELRFGRTHVGRLAQ